MSKFRYDGFLGTNLEYLLRARDIRTVVVAGATTNVCVKSTGPGSPHAGFPPLRRE